MPAQELSWKGIVPEAPPAQLVTAALESPPIESAPLDNAPLESAARPPGAPALQLLNQLERPMASRSARPEEVKFPEAETVSAPSLENMLKRLLSAWPSCKRASNSPNSPEPRRSCNLA